MTEHQPGRLPRMRILVTGGCGFIGAHLIRHLLERTANVVINVDALSYAADREFSRRWEKHPRHVFRCVDLANDGAITAVFEEFQPDAVVHLAAESHVDRSIDGPEACLRANVLGSFHLLEATLAYWRALNAERRERFRFLHVSTDEVFGSLTAQDAAFNEMHPYAPRSPYSATKAAADHLVRAWHHTYGLPVIVTHCSNNYGPYQFPEKLIPVVILHALRGEPIAVYGSGTQVRDWLFVEDHVDALMRVLTNGRCGETYNIGGESERTNLELVRTVCAILDQERPQPSGKGSCAEGIALVADRPGHDFRYAMDTRKIRRELGWQPAIQLETGLRQTVRWYLDNEAWWQRILREGHSLGRRGLR